MKKFIFLLFFAFFSMCNTQLTPTNHTSPPQRGTSDYLHHLRSELQENFRLLLQHLDNPLDSSARCSCLEECHHPTFHNTSLIFFDVLRSLREDFRAEDPTQYLNGIIRTALDYDSNDALILLLEVDEWMDEIINPSLPIYTILGASPVANAKYLFDRITDSIFRERHVFDHELETFGRLLLAFQGYETVGSYFALPENERFPSETTKFVAIAQAYNKRELFF